MIVTPLCSSSASPPRLVPRAETGAAEHASIPAALLSRCGGSAIWTPSFRSPKRYCKAETQPTVCWIKTTLFAFLFTEDTILKKPFMFLKNRIWCVRHFMWETEMQMFFLKKIHARVISGSKTFFITCFLSFWTCLSYDDAIFTFENQNGL